MNKSEFVKAIAEKAGLTQKQADEALKAYIEVIKETLKKGKKIQLVGFGSYELKNKPAREVFNPLTKKKMKVKASKVPAFKMGKAFKQLF